MSLSNCTRLFIREKGYNFSLKHNYFIYNHINWRSFHEMLDKDEAETIVVK